MKTFLFFPAPTPQPILITWNGKDLTEMDAERLVDSKRDLSLRKRELEAMYQERADQKGREATELEDDYQEIQNLMRAALEAKRGVA